MTVKNEIKLLKYIVLSQMKGLGPVTHNALLKICGDIAFCFEAQYDDLVNADSLGPNKTEIVKSRIESFIDQRDDRNLWVLAEEILRSSKTSGIKVITYEDIKFPERFRNIYDMPVVLYAKGKLRINEFNKSIGIVGARRCTAEGKKMAIDVAERAADSNIAVISGMAKGIDSYAHTASIKSDGYTIAVLGNGADVCYPKEHERLYEEISERGCILSEYPPKTPPREYNFPKRNRLIAALSDQLYVIEAGRNSGANSTMKNSVRYGREVIKYVETVKGICCGKFYD